MLRGRCCSKHPAVLSHFILTIVVSTIIILILWMSKLRNTDYLARKQAEFEPREFGSKNFPLNFYTPLQNIE